MIYTIFFAALVCFATAHQRTELEYQQEFTQYVRDFSKTYASTEFLTRFNIFKTNLDLIDFMNADPQNTFTTAINQFADMTNEEFRAYNRLSQVDNSYFRSLNEVDLSGLEAPSSIDWGQQGAVTPVKNQGQCGSCWAFSTTGSVEGAWKLAGNSLPSLSEQQLVDCAGSFGNLGCNGGLMDDAFQWIMQNGITSESAYSYTGRDGSCQKGKPSIANIKGFVDVRSGSESALLAAVGNSGPVSVAIEADQFSFQFYNNGVFNSRCGTRLDHGVLVTGYGTDNGQDYWKVKNSWGGSWGESGYIRIQRGSNLCGIAEAASYPTV